MASRSSASAGTASFAHIVVVIMENHSFDQIMGSGSTPFIHSLAAGGLLLTDMHGVSHPSQPNYVALFSGATQGVSSDSCPRHLDGANLAGQLIAAGRTFTGYSEGLPSPGYTGCSSGPYARKHNPWADYASLPASVNQPWSAFPSDYSMLPSVAFVVPNLDNDMHDGSIRTGDTWLSAHLGAYAQWARAHDSLLIVTWDEDDFGTANRIATVLYGAHVRPGSTFAGHADHYATLRLIEDSLGLGPLGGAATATRLTAQMT